ncbi:hypothetical protein R3P38DRAFT_2933282 [Favolaschia claudopus]|uniref:MYND-type domain-containing protein n=1 Tax=Favolaschia claudopus TaxID=2862362 RepID=A0AAW0BUN5_9AGAR
MSPPHPLLDLGRIKLLRPNLKILAQGACKDGKEALVHIDAIYNMVVSEASSNISFDWALPVFYRVLDSGAGSLTDGDFAAARRIARRTMLILRSLSILLSRKSLNWDYMVHFWPRIWEHILFEYRFITELCHVFRLDDPIGKLFPVHLTLITLMAALGREQADEKQFVTYTPGVITHLTRIWRAWVHEESIRSAVDVEINLSKAFGELAVGPDLDNTTELIAGAGSNVQDLLTLVLTYLDIKISAHRFSVPGYLPSQLLACAICLGSEVDDDTLQMLVGQGFIRRLVTLVSVLQSHPTPYQLQETGGVIDQCYISLFCCLQLRSERVSLVEAIKHGLIRCLATTCVDRRFDHLSSLDPNRHWIRLLDHICTRLDNRSVVRVTSKAILKREMVHLVAQLENTSAWERWDKWLNSVQEATLRVVEFADSPRPLKFCDNLTCEVVAPRKHFRCCGHCRKRCYCSPACQKADWVNHRRFCAALDIGPGWGDDYLARCLRDEYIVHRSSILREYAGYMIENEGRSDFAMKWLLSDEAVERRIVSFDLLAHDITESQRGQYNEILDRVNREGSQIEVHAFGKLRGPSVDFWIAELRSSGGLGRRERLEELVDDFLRGQIDEVDYKLGLDALVSGLEEDSDKVISF